MIIIDTLSRVPIYEQICHSVVELAAQGLIAPGEKLPSVREVSKEYGVNPNTVSKAFSMLERDGIITSVPGKGSFLSESYGGVIRETAVREFTESTAKAIKRGLTKEELHGIVDSANDGEDGK